MNDQVKGTLVGDPVAAPDKLAPPKSRAERIKDWQKANRAAYKEACEGQCTCTPSRAQMLLINQWDNPPID